MTLPPNEDDWPCDCRHCGVCIMLGIGPRPVFAPPAPKPEPKPEKRPASLFDEIKPEESRA